jgi:GH25 family lysozyme M1 (1,4-beta-N-acetylmuramidase)
MQPRSISRRQAIATGISAISSICIPTTASGQVTADPATEFDLVDEPTRGFYANYDVANFGPPAFRNARRNFVFPNDAEVNLAYGLDVSHHTKEVPWLLLKASKVNYVYIKASQSTTGRDGKFVEFWRAAGTSGLPIGAYHFLTAGVSGRSQAEFFLKRLRETSGLGRGNLQPVIDLEWDVNGPGFKRVVAGTTSSGSKVYKDYWDGVATKDIIAAVNDFADTIRSGLGSLAIKPVIYTNRSWWEEHIPAGTVFPGCTIWISDYRQQSYQNNSPRSVPGHEYYIWQFTDLGKVVVGNRQYGPFDCNKLIFGEINRITIA